MKIKSLIWLEDITEKLIRKHNLEEYEVKEVLESKPYFCFIEKGHRKGENVYSALGQTRSGRHLVVFFVYKKDKSALVLSAREMTKSERRIYEQR